MTLVTSTGLSPVQSLQVRRNSLQVRINYYFRFYYNEYHFADDEIKESVKEKVISDVLIQQCSDPMLDFQFGDVQEILEELSRTKSQDKTEPEEIQQVAETQQEAEEIKTDNKHHNANIHSEEKEVSSVSSEHCTEDVIREAETVVEINVQETVLVAAECLKNNHHQTDEIPSKVKHNKSNAKKKSKKKKSTKVTTSHSQVELVTPVIEKELPTFCEPLPSAKNTDLMNIEPQDKWTQVKSSRKSKTLNHQQTTSGKKNTFNQKKNLVEEKKPELQQKLDTVNLKLDSERWG